VDGNALLIWAVTEHLWLSDERLHPAQNSRACFSALFLQFTVLHIYLDACENDSNAVVVCMFACVRARVCVPLPPSIFPSFLSSFGCLT